jgi:hypothetical protein
MPRFRAVLDHVRMRDVYLRHSYEEVTRIVSGEVAAKLDPSAHYGNDEEGWLKKLSELETQEERLLDLYLEGKLEIGRYESRVSQIKQSRRTIEDELQRIKNHATH